MTICAGTFGRNVSSIYQLYAFLTKWKPRETLGQRKSITVLELLIYTLLRYDRQVNFCVYLSRKPKKRDYEKVKRKSLNHHSSFLEECKTFAI